MHPVHRLKIAAAVILSGLSAAAASTDTRISPKVPNSTADPDCFICVKTRDARITCTIAAGWATLLTAMPTAESFTSGLTIAIAKHMASACITYARMRKGAVNIWVYDTNGQVVHFERMGGAALIGAPPDVTGNAVFGAAIDPNSLEPGTLETSRSGLMVRRSSAFEPLVWDLLRITPAQKPLRPQQNNHPSDVWTMLHTRAGKHRFWNIAADVRRHFW